jgi:hypothetical protein
MKQSDWLRSLSERAGFLHPAALKRNCPLWNATARSGFRGKNWGVKQFLNEKICQKRLKNIA